MEENSLLSLVPCAFRSFGDNDLHICCTEMLVEFPLFKFRFPFPLAI
jgi:hypothetical protein